MTMIKSGDKVVCVNAHLSGVVRGGEYKATNLKGNDMQVVGGQRRMWYPTSCFMLVEELPYPTPNERHPHYDIIVAWAEGAIIEVSKDETQWVECATPKIQCKLNYRIQTVDLVEEQRIVLRKQLANLAEDKAKLEKELSNL